MLIYRQCELIKLKYSILWLLSSLTLRPYAQTKISRVQNVRFGRDVAAKTYVAKNYDNKAKTSICHWVHQFASETTLHIRE